MRFRNFWKRPGSILVTRRETSLLVITDARVLQEEFIPEEVEHRHDEVNHLSNALQPVVNDEQPENAFLYGPTGTGKTCIAKFTVEQLREEVLDVNYQYVNCWQDYNRFRVLYRLLEAIGQTTDIHRNSTPKDELLERLRTANDEPFVVILDEVDQLEDTRVLYDLYEMPHVTMVLIANREDELFVNLDDRVASRLKGSTRIWFDTYSTKELTAILRARVQWGLSPGAIDPERLKLIADIAAGDARVAIGILRSAARHAERNGLDVITSSAVKEAVPEARDEIHEKTIEKLNAHQVKIYNIIQEHGEVDPSELYTRYREEVADPKTDRTVRNYLAKMEHYNLIVAEGSGRARTYYLK